MSTERELFVVSVDRMDGTEIVVEFSDGTIGIYTTAQLAEVSPDRKQADPRLAGQTEREV